MLPTHAFATAAGVIIGASSEWEDERGSSERWVDAMGGKEIERREGTAGGRLSHGGENEREREMDGTGRISHPSIFFCFVYCAITRAQ